MDKYWLLAPIGIIVLALCIVHKRDKEILLECATTGTASMYFFKASIKCEVIKDAK